MNNLRAYRVKKLMTQKDLAEASGVDAPTISFIETERTLEPNDLTQMELTIGLGMKTSDAGKVFPDNDLWGSGSLGEYRVKKLMTQKDLAKLAGITQTTISYIEGGLSEPMDLTKQKLSEALEIEPEILFQDDNIQNGNDFNGNNLRSCRVKQHMTQKDLAKVAGVSSVTISFIENDTSSPTDETKQKLSRALKVEPDVLFPVRSKKCC